MYVLNERKELITAIQQHCGVCWGGYPSLPTGYPGYPTATTLAAASLAHKMVPPHLSSLYSSPSIAPSLGFPHPGLGHAMGLNGVPGSNPQFNGKDPLRR